MIIVQSDRQANRIFKISEGDFKEIVTTDASGVAKVSKEAWELLQTKYRFKEFKQIESTTEKVEQAEPLPEVEENTQQDPSFSEIVENINSINELKSMAEELGLPKEEWSGYKRKDYFKKYLIEKINDAENS